MRGKRLLFLNLAFLKVDPMQGKRAGCTSKMMVDPLRGKLKALGFILREGRSRMRVNP